MKFFTYLALIGATSAMRLGTHHAAVAPAHNLAQLQTPAILHKQFKAFLQTKGWDDVHLTPEQEEEIKAWVEEKLTTGDHEISWKELKDGVKEFCEKHDMPLPDKKMVKEAKAVFKKVDTDGSGGISLSELEAALEHYEEHGAIQIKKFKTLLQTKGWDDVELTDEQEAEIEGWVKEKLTTGDHEISWEELVDGVTEFCEKHDMPLPDKKMVKEAKAVFKKVDTDGSGGISLSELEAALEHYEEHGAIQVKAMKNYLMTQGWDDVELTDEQEAEIKAWVEEKLTTGDHEISWPELVDGVTEFCEKHDMPLPDKKMVKEAKHVFKKIDTDGSGGISLSELEAALEHYEEHGAVQIKNFKTYLQTKVKGWDDVELTDEQEAEIEAWVKEKLTTGDKEISWHELVDGVTEFCEAHDLPLPDKKMVKEAKAVFKKVDTDGSGGISLSELEAAIEYCEKHEC